MAIKYFLDSSDTADPTKLAFEPLKKVNTMNPSSWHESYLHIRTLKCELINVAGKLIKQNRALGFNQLNHSKLPQSIENAYTRKTNHLDNQIEFKRMKSCHELLCLQIAIKITNINKYCNYKSMLHLFKSKNYRKAISLLDSLGLDNDDFKEFQLQQIGSKLRIYEVLFPSIREIIHEMKLSPLKTLKISIFYLHIFHLSTDKNVFEQIIELLHELQVRVHSLMRARKGLIRTDSTDTLSTSKEFLQKETEMVAIDLSSIILAKIVIPLISFQQKLITCNHQYQTKEEDLNLGQCETWSRMNLLRKIVEIGSDIESLGRYFFKESANAVLCLMRIINHDIQSLYKKIVVFFRRKIIGIKIILQENPNKMQEVINKQGISEFLMMNQQLQIINEKLRILYNGRYFIHHLANNFIFLPPLFTENEHMDLFYKIKQHQLHQQKKHKLQLSTRRKKGKEVQEAVQDI